MSTEVEHQYDYTQNTNFQDQVNEDNDNTNLDDDAQQLTAANQEEEPSSSHLSSTEKNDIEQSAKITTDQLLSNKGGPSKEEFMKAAQEGSLSTLTLSVIKKSVNVNEKDEQGFTALHYASMQEQLPAVIHLITNEAEINVTDNEGKTPLHYACEKENYPIVRYLLKKGADKTKKDNSDKSPEDFVKEKEMSQLESLLSEF